MGICDYLDSLPGDVTGVVVFAADEFAVDFPFGEVFIDARSDDWWLLLFLHDDGHGIASCVSLV